MTYDVPLRDSGPPRASTSAYPVRLDGDYTTMLAITNAGAAKGDLTLQINYPGGPYQFGLMHLNPGETRLVDIRKLRDQRKADNNGHILPQNLTTGQIRWSIRGNGNIPMTGRAEVVSLHDHVSSSYSCTTCCPSSHQDGWLDPSFFEIFVEDFQTVKGKERQRDCYGNVYGPYDNDWGNWYAANPDIATVDTNGVVEGVDTGSAGFSFTYPVYYWFQDFDEQCIPFESTDSGSSNSEVNSAPDHVKVVLDQAGFPASCSTTGIYVRQIKVQVVDVGGANVGSVFSVAESYSNLSPNTGNNGSPTPAACGAADAGGTILDSMAVSDQPCSSNIPQGSGCGFTLTSTWSICSGTTHNAIWTSSRETRSNNVKVNGSSSVYSSGTFLYP